MSLVGDNREWVIWLHAISPLNRKLVMRDELFYFDEWQAGRMTLFEILEDAGCLELAQ